MRRKKITRLCTVVAVALGTVGAAASMASATKPDPEHKVTICHATASETNPYVVITVDIASIVGDAGHGHSGVNIGDIIPPFNMDGYLYAGHNWDAEHAAIYNNGCCNLSTGGSGSTTTTSGAPAWWGSTTTTSGAAVSGSTATGPFNA
jgi:hypothetical protein